MITVYGKENCQFCEVLSTRGGQRLMDLGSILYLGVTLGLFIIFALIVIRTYSKKRKEQGEIAKYKMLEDD